MKLTKNHKAGEICFLKRKRLKLTQIELSIRTGVSFYTISALENDHRIPAAKTLRKLADALDLTANERDTFLKALSERDKNIMKGGE